MSNIPFVVARPVRRGREATADDFGAGIGRATAQLGESINVLGQGVSELAGATARIIKAKDDQADNLAIGQAANEIAQIDRDFLTDSDPSTADERYGAKMREIEERFDKERPGGFDLFGNPGMTRLKSITNAAIQKQKDTTRLRAIAIGRADGREAVRLLTEAAAQADTQEERDTFRDLAVDTVDRAELSGLETPEAARLARVEIDQGITNAITARLEREDPALAFTELSDINGPLTRGLTEEQRQARLTSALAAIAATDRKAQSDEDRALKVEQRDRKEAGRTLQNDWIEQSADGEPPSLTEVILGIQTGNIEPTIAEKWVKVTQDGFNPATSDVPLIYDDLFNRSVLGEDIHKAVTSAYLDGDITKGSRDSLLKSSKDVRFGEARSLLVDTLRVSTLSQDPAGQARSAQAKSDFDEWAFNNPKATRDQARTRAQNLIAGASTIPLDKIPAFNVKPALAVMEDGKLKRKETAARIQLQLDTGIIDAGEAAAETRVMTRFLDAQEAQKRQQDAIKAERAAEAAARAEQ